MTNTGSPSRRAATESNDPQNQLGPLQGLRVLELAGMGPGPFCGMVLADLGAEVVRVERAVLREAPLAPSRYSLVNRGKSSIALDLQTPDGVEKLLQLVVRADVLFEGYRPGVAERLGVGPTPCLERNPRLVYGRMTGWGQTGRLAQTPGHDINYLALSGALSGIGPAEQPFPPLNLLGDFGGGGMVLAMGILAALFSVQYTGEGQVVDASMVEGVSLLATGLHGLIDGGLWSSERGKNLFDGGAPFYTTYRCGDGQFLAVGALESRFYSALLDTLGLSGSVDATRQMDRSDWPAATASIATVFRQRSREEWLTAFADIEACVTPVLTLVEAREHPHSKDRRSFVDVAGIVQPVPAPRYSRTPAAIPAAPHESGVDTDDVLARWLHD